MIVMATSTALGGEAHAAETAGGRWIEREVVDPSGVATGAANAFINEECRPADLSGISIFGVQKGHGEPIRLHVWCRADHASGVRYDVSLIRFPKGAYAPAVEGPLRENARIGPFVFGLSGGPDGMVVLRRIAGARRP